MPGVRGSRDSGSLCDIRWTTISYVDIVSTPNSQRPNPKRTPNLQFPNPDRHFHWAWNLGVRLGVGTWELGIDCVTVRDTAAGAAGTVTRHGVRGERRGCLSSIPFASSNPRTRRSAWPKPTRGWNLALPASVC